ncbi:MAG: hypothetical protein GEV11_15885 [Streptosporangiales bacterium]|nr:hypothetical protein [Streptosporangiales bacterium]
MLRAYEPVLAYTAGERFFPTAIDEYVACCSLWRSVPGGSEEQLVAPGEVTLDRLAGADKEWPRESLHLRFVQESSLRAEARRLKRTTRTVIARTGRLAAVGLVARIADVLLRISLLVRGVLPGGVAAAAAARYRTWVGTAESTYYARVVRDGGYVVCQYWFFYPMNDWRSTFGGVNDHEADWEMVSVYLSEGPDGPRPVWVGISSHDGAGDDLRRRWDDPDLRRVGDHPVVFVGAGSHSGAALPGDYLIAVDPEPMRILVKIWNKVARRLFLGRIAHWRGFSIPYVDYHRGDGTHIGAGGDRSWNAVMISDDTPWVRGFRGLWGWDTHDWLNGERAPTGPRYERDGAVRFSWTDPVGWVGLQKVPPDPGARDGMLTERCDELDLLIAEADTRITTLREELRALRSIALSLREYAQTREKARTRFTELEGKEKELAAAYRDRAALMEEREVHRASLAAPPPEEPPQVHLRSPHLPYASGRQVYNRFLQLWAPLSTPLMLFAVIAAIYLVPWDHPLLKVAGVILLFAAIDALARKRGRAFLNGLGVLAVVAVPIAVLVAAFMWNWQITLLVPLLVAAVTLLVANVRDLRS